MTSLIFGTIYLAHQGVVHARHEKKRVKNYERWEGLRDEYDEQRRIQRETRSTQSLDLQRTGQPFEDDRPILTLRDQQEAGDARTGWRPQEAWNGPADNQSAAPTGRQSMDATTSSFDYDHRAAIAGSHNRTSSQPGLGRSASLSNGYNANNNSSTPSLAPQPTGYHGIGPMRPAPTGANWDDGLPRRLTVQKRNVDDPPAATSGPTLGRSISLRTAGSENRSRSNLGSANSSSHNLPLSNSTTHTSPLQQQSALATKNSSDNINNPFAAGNRFDTPSQITASPVTLQGGFSESQFGSRRDSLAPINSGPAMAQTEFSNNPFESRNRFDSKPTPAMQQQSFPPPLQPVQPQMTSNNPFEPGNRFDSPNGGGSNPFGPMSGSAIGATQTFAQGGRMATLVEGKTPAGEKDMSEWWK